MLFSINRESVDEMGIQPIKAELKNMRKSTEYIQARLRRIHKLAGFEYLKVAFGSTARRQSKPKNFHVFGTKANVRDRYNKGLPLSCFSIDGDLDHVFVAIRAKDACKISYVTFKCNYVKDTKLEAGVHFCRFEMLEGTTTKSLDELNPSNYAIMLPYFRQNGDRPREYIKQYTLIYSDWEVLRIDLPEKRKGPACICEKLFKE